MRLSTRSLLAGPARAVCRAAGCSPAPFQCAFARVKRGATRTVSRAVSGKWDAPPEGWGEWEKSRKFDRPGGFDDFGDTLERERGGRGGRGARRERTGGWRDESPRRGGSRGRDSGFRRDRGSYGDDGGFRGGRPGADRARGRGRGGHERDRGEFRRGGDYDDGDSGPQWRTRRELRGGGPAPILADLSGEVVWGVSPVIAAMRSGRRELYKLFVQDGLGSGQGRRRDRSALQAALAAAEERGVPVDYVSKHDLNLLSDNRPHQGLAIDASPIEPTNLETPPPAERAAGATRAPVWVALDEVTDPQNLGAVLRSAHFLGVDGVVICAKNSAPLSPVVSKASAGALEVMPVHAVGNLMRWLHRCQEEGWEVLGAEAGEDSVDIREVSVESPTVLVLGSEGFGLRPLVRRACSAFVRIDGGVEASGESVEGFEVDSLNVSVAAGIAMHHLTRG